MRLILVFISWEKEFCGSGTALQKSDHSFCKARKKLAREEEEEADETRWRPADSLARARLFMFINVPYVRIYRFAVSLSFLSRDNDTDLRQLSRNRGFKWT